jgi:pimeloyl-ACP methyl ester carboxylesterase
VREFRDATVDATLRAIEVAGTGRGAPIVFLHGLGSASSVAFRPVADDPALAGRRMLLVDLLGFGHSERPADWGYTLDGHAAAVAALLDDAGVRGCCLVGHSIGGTIAILLAAVRPDLIGSLVVAEPNMESCGGMPSSLIAAQSEAGFIAEGHAALVRLFAADPGSASYAATLALSSPVGLHRSARGLVAPREPAAGAILRGLSVPRTFLVGERNLPYPDADDLPAVGIEVVAIPGAGHNMSLENPPAFAAAVEAAAASADRAVAAADHAAAVERAAAATSGRP